MLPKHQRLSRKADVPQILKEGESFQAKSALFKFLPNREETCRFAVIVSTKVSKKAVERNTLRRRLYEAIRTNIDEKGEKQHFDTVVLPSKRGLDNSYQALEKDTIKFLNHIGHTHTHE